MTEANFIRHCDHTMCDLGRFVYECPKCMDIVADFEIWWLEDEIYRGRTYEFECINCHEKLNVSYNRDEFEYQININV